MSVSRTCKHRASRLSREGVPPMFRQRRIKQKMSLKDRLASFAEVTREKARRLRPGREQDDMLMRARHADTAAHIDDWANSPGLQFSEVGQPQLASSFIIRTYYASFHAMGILDRSALIPRRESHISQANETRKPTAPTKATVTKNNSARFMALPNAGVARQHRPANTLPFSALVNFIQTTPRNFRVG